MHEVLVNRLGGLSLPRKSVVRLTDRPDMTLDVYRGRKTTMQQQQQQNKGIIPPVYQLKTNINWPLPILFQLAQVITISAINSFTATMKSHLMMGVIMTDTRCSTFAHN